MTELSQIVDDEESRQILDQSQDTIRKARVSYHPDITMETLAGRLINKQMRKWDEAKVENNKEYLRPRVRGKVYCFGYFGMPNHNEPLFTLGPDYKWSLTELVLLNSAMIVPLLFIESFRTYVVIGICL